MIYIPKRVLRGFVILAGATTFIACGKLPFFDVESGSKGSLEYDPLNLTFDLTIDHYNSCAELETDIRAQLEMAKRNNEQANAWYNDQAKNTYERADSAPIAGGHESDDLATGAESFTNTQEKGVDEADFIKVGENHIFVSQSGEIEVVNRHTLEKVGKISTDGLSNLNLYTDDNTLVVLGVSREIEENCPEVSYDDFCGTPSPNGASILPDEAPEYGERICYKPPTTVVKVYSSEAQELPTLVGEQIFDGSYIDSRYVGSRVVLVFRSSINASLENEGSVIEFDGDRKVNGIACNAIGKQYVKDLDFRMTKVATVNAMSIDEEPKVIGVFAGGDHLYMTTKNLYVTKQGLNWIPWVPPTDQKPNFFIRREELIITKIGFNAETGQVAALAAGAVEGRVKDEWAFKEYAEDETLLVATTTFQELLEDETVQPDWTQHNHLWSLSQEGTTLKINSSVNNFGPTEDIRAVRFVGNMGYVVTFEKTDPLFAFDLTNPREPKLLGELIIPGFSTYLHPVADGRLVGVGFDGNDQGSFSWFQGIQVSLFDVSDPMNMERIDNKTHGHRGSYSDVNSDHHTFFFDKERALVGVPVVELTRPEGSGSGGSQYGSNLTFSGAVIYKVEETELVETAKLTHNDLIPADCTTSNQHTWWSQKTKSMDINRLFVVDDRLLTLSRFGIKAHDLNNPSTVTNSVAFDSTSQDCSIY